MGRIGRGRTRTRVVVIFATFTASGCSVLFGLDDHSAPPGPGIDGSLDTGGTLPDGRKPDSDSDTGSEDGGHDTGTDAPPVECTDGVRFTQAALIPGLEHAAHQHSVRGLNGGARAYLASERPVEGPAVTGSHIFRATFNGAAFVVDPTLPPGPINSSGLQRHASATDDDMQMVYIHMNGSTLGEVWRATRDASTINWNARGRLQDLPVGATYADVYMTPDGQHLYYTSNKDGNLDIYESIPQSPPNDKYTAGTRVANVSTGEMEMAPVVTPDLATMYFARNTGGTLRVYVASGAGYATIKPACGLANTENAYPTWISSNGVLYYVKYAGDSGRRELWQAKRAD